MFTLSILTTLLGLNIFHLCKCHNYINKHNIRIKKQVGFRRKSVSKSVVRLSSSYYFASRDLNRNEALDILTEPERLICDKILHSSQ